MRCVTVVIADQPPIVRASSGSCCVSHRRGCTDIQIFADRSVLLFLNTSATSLTQMPPHELAGRGYPLTGLSGVANICTPDHLRNMPRITATTSAGL